MAIPLLDLKEQFQQIEDEVRKNFDAVFASQRFIMGPMQKELEAFIGNMLGAEALAVSSGTDALLISLMAQDIQPGDEILVPDFTFFATAGTIARLRAVPIFCDVDRETCNISADSIARKVTDRTRAIIPVHLFGQSADMDAIMELAGEKGLAVIEDACQSIGARYKDKYTATIGNSGAFSFFPSKNLGGMGDGGMVLTRDKALYQKLVHLRNHGQSDRYFHTMVGGNFRMDEFQAAALLAKAPRLSGYNENRRRNAARYNKLLAGLVDKELVQTPVERYHHVYHQYVIRARDRDKLKQHLDAQGIGNAVYYPVPLHLQPCFAYLGSKDSDFPVTNSLCQDVLALPIFPELTEDQIGQVADQITAFYNRV